MTILKHIGRDYTWTNVHTYSRIDWRIVNTNWMLSMPSTEVQIMDPGCSDHSPLSISFSPLEEVRPRPFKFLNHLLKHAQFQDIVKHTWQENIRRLLWEECGRN